MTVVHYIWDELNDNVMMEKDENGNVLAQYQNTPGLYGRPVSQTRDGDKSYFHYDGLGNVSAITDENQNITDTFEYKAFGELVERTGVTETPYQYKGAFGYQTDSASESVYVRRRTYESKTGRWLSPDPAMFYDSSNLYEYAGNSPLRFVDPSGLARVRCKCNRSTRDFIRQSDTYTKTVECGTTPPRVCCRSACMDDTTTTWICGSTGTWSVTPKSCGEILIDFEVNIIGWFEKQVRFTKQIAKQVEFEFEVARGQDAKRCCFIQFRRGFVRSRTTGRFAVAPWLGRGVIDVNSRDWIIDSIDVDPVYGSKDGLRWDYEQVSNNRFVSSDAPSVPAGYESRNEFKTCVIDCNDVPLDGTEARAEALISKTIQCKDWTVNVDVNSDLTFTAFD